MAELVLEIPNQGKIPSLNDRMGWQQRRQTLAAWRSATVMELRHAALRRPDEHAAVRDRPCTIQLDVGVITVKKVRDPHNFVVLAKAVIDELKLQPAYAPKNGTERKRRLRDRDGRPLSINSGWALWPDDGPEWVELIDARFHAGNTTSIIITTKEPQDGQRSIESEAPGRPAPGDGGGGPG